MTTPKTIPTAAIHSGVVAGNVRVNSMLVTKKPSLTSCPRTEANQISNTIPATKTVTYRGRKYARPCRTQSQMLVGS